MCPSVTPYYFLNSTINEEQYKEWADDNAFIENIVLETLKLNRYE